MSASRTAQTGGILLLATVLAHESAGFHPALGIAFAGVAAVHLARNRRRLLGYASRLGRGLAPAATRRALVALLLVAGLAIQATSGTALLLGADGLRGLHFHVAVTLFALAAVHAFLHRRSFLRRPARAVASRG
jgi:hypothetical protein